MSPVTALSLDDLSFLLDIRLSQWNIYQFTFVSAYEDMDGPIADIIQMSRKHSLASMIQDSSVNHVHVTFVTFCKSDFFREYIKGLVKAACERHNVPLFNII